MPPQKKYVSGLLHILDFMNYLKKIVHSSFHSKTCQFGCFLPDFYGFRMINLKYLNIFVGLGSADYRKGGIGLEQAAELFETHRALFVDKADGDVYPRTFSDKDEKSVLNTFNSFYSWNTVYELTRQWIVKEGDFDFNFFWLTSKYSKSEITEWVSNYFKNTYGVSPLSFKII